MINLRSNFLKKTICIVSLLLLISNSVAFSQNSFQATIQSNECPNLTYSLDVNFELLEVVPTSVYSTGYNYNLKFKYDINLTGNIMNGWCGGPLNGNLNTFQVEFTCYENQVLGYYQLPLHLSQGHTIGQATTVTNQAVDYTHIKPGFSPLQMNSKAVNPEILKCVTARLIIGGVGIPQASQNVILTGKGNTGSSLPVSLLDFTSKNNKSQVELDWSTASERNAAYYIVSKSHDLVNFETLERIPANGTTTELSSYQIVDNDPSDEVTYYRLVQYDFDGTRNELKTISNQFTPPTIIAIYNELGQAVEKDYTGFVIYRYSDGSSEKTIQ